MSNMNIGELFARAATAQKARDYTGAIALLTTILNHAGASPRERGEAFMKRADARGWARDLGGTIEDYTTALELPLSAMQIADALYFRGRAKELFSDDRTAGRDDFELVLQLQGTSPKQRADAFYSLGCGKHWAGDFKGAFANYSAILAISDAPAESRAQALLARVETRIELRDRKGELADCNDVIGMAEAPPALKAKAFFQRGCYHQHVARDVKAAAADYRAALNISDASDRLRELVSDAMKELDQDDQVDLLIDELVSIGYKSPPDRLQSWTSFLSQANHRAREIGEILNTKGGLDLMLHVHARVVERLAPRASRELEVAWGGISDWQG